MIEETRKFYNNLQDFHDKVNKILELIIDYFEANKKMYKAEYVALRLENNRVIESNVELEDNEKVKIESWYLSNNKRKLDENIYTIELRKKILFCKIFKFDENNIVIAGYSLKETIPVRMFISSFTEKKIREKYEKILAII